MSQLQWSRAQGETAVTDHGRYVINHNSARFVLPVGEQIVWRARGIDPEDIRNLCQEHADDYREPTEWGVFVKGTAYEVFIGEAQPIFGFLVVIDDQYFTIENEGGGLHAINIHTIQSVKEALSGSRKEDDDA